MKYLKLYNESKMGLSNEVKLECGDILLELRDLGFKTYVEISGTSKKRIYIEISSPEKFKFSDIEEVVLRLSDYLGSKELFVQHELPSDIRMASYMHQTGQDKPIHRWEYRVAFSECKELSEGVENFDPTIRDLQEICMGFDELDLKINVTHGLIQRKKDKERSVYKVEAIYESIEKNYPNYGGLLPMIESLQEYMSDYRCNVLCNLFVPKDDWRWRSINLKSPPPDKVIVSYLKVIFTEK